MAEVQVELLYFRGCPSYLEAWTLLGDVLVELGLDATVRLRDVESVAPGCRRGFAGSPTIRIGGRDLEGYDGPALWACRRYADNQGRGWPSAERLRQALRAARDRREAAARGEP